jgi:Group II intron, maturase-specific domain/Reverse transcriptase (RNA-dependent DNA polymerase)/Transposase
MHTVADRAQEPTTVHTDLRAIFVSLELSRSTWLITSLSPGSGEKMSKYAVRGGDLAQLLQRFAQLQEKARLRTRRSYPIIVIQEAGLDGFWIHRVLQTEGIESFVVDAASIATSRRRRRAKTDRLDGEALVRALLAHKRGEPRVCAMVKAPTPEEEDRRRLCRERKVLTMERVQHVNRVKGLLFAQGIVGYPSIPFERYADDAICHCASEAQALELRQALEQRFAACRLRLHPQKTKIVYCKDANRPGDYPERAFDFLGYRFRSRVAVGRGRKHFVSFIPAVSDKAAKRMRQEVRRWRLHLRSDLELEEIAKWVRPTLAGWVRYYGRFYPSKLREDLRTIDAFIVRWVSRKYKRFRGHTLASWEWLRSLRQRNPNLFAHWALGPAAG